VPSLAATEASPSYSRITRRTTLHILVSIDRDRRCIHKDLNKQEQTFDVVCVCVCVCGVCVTCTHRDVDMHPSMCCVCAHVCVPDMYIQRCRHAPEHTHIHLRIQMPMYVEVWNIMAFNLDVPDPDNQEQLPDVVRKRSWHLSDSCQHSVDRGERRTHSHARLRAGTLEFLCISQYKFKL